MAKFELSPTNNVFFPSFSHFKGKTLDESSFFASTASYIILDTNILLYWAQKPFNLQNEVQKLISRKVIFLILPEVFYELKKLYQRQPKLRRAIKLILSIISDQNSNFFLLKKSLTQGRTTDEAILSFAHKYHCIVATSDKTLKQQLIRQGITIIYLREQKRIDGIGLDLLR